MKKCFNYIDIASNIFGFVLSSTLIAAQPALISLFACEEQN